MYRLLSSTQDVMTLVLENRPEQPLDFIAEYFRSIVRGATPISRSFRYIRMHPRGRETFMENLASAYLVLDSKVGQSTGLTGREYNKLLRLVCNDFPVDIVDTIFGVLDKQNNDTIDFRSFCAGINSCLLYEEFFEQVEWLFKGFDVNSTGSIEVSSLLHIIHQIRSAPPSSLSSSSTFNIPSPEHVKESLELIGVECSIDKSASSATSASPSKQKSSSVSSPSSSLPGVVLTGSKKRVNFKEFVRSMFRLSASPHP